MKKVKSIYKNSFRIRIKKILARLKLFKLPKWQRDSNLLKREYQSYDEYKKHQSSKLGLLDLTDYDEKYKNTLIARYEKKSNDLKGVNLLCLGARTGSECKAFIELGAFAIGLDLNPGLENKYVLTGDFHNIQFANNSVDIVFSNALDHAFDIEKMINEIKRVLKPKGLFFVELVNGTNDINGRNPGEYESLWWDSVAEISIKIKSLGLDICSEEQFDFPWNGTQIVYKKS